MSTLLSSTAIRSVEARHSDLHPPLMERAGRAAAEVALRILGEASSCVLVVAGPGNNGGDGFVVARLLKEAGRDVVVACGSDARVLPPDAAIAREAWDAAGGRTVADFVGSQWGLVVDALFGIGLKRPVDGRHAECIARINAMGCPVLALDVPSGLDADTGAVRGSAVRATHTASFIALKPGLLTLDGPDHCGELSLHDLGLEVPEGEGALLERAMFAAYLRARPRNAHKGMFGDAGVIGGAAGMTGAALLAARAGLKLGAGRVFLGLLDAAAPGFDPACPELMLRPPGDLHLLSSALAVGPGLGQSEQALQQLRRALGFAGPLLLDADALNLLAAHPGMQQALVRREAATVLTPHPAEAARLLQCSTAEVQMDRVASACEMARRFQADVVLKGCGSVLATAEGRWCINTSGHPGMASAGMGDVLSGLVLALLAQGWPATSALAAGVHLHGRAAERLAHAGIGPVGLSASELIDAARAEFNDWLPTR
ncbi:NAD(P)H-hydrate dehydratase [Uliginosibacterium sp. H1]|uniref:NAD(P)H-hydrate dehydratase n=1 Tax=Uliginosibacterium sp. H1 TaxID=3114757 RepID=UPI002E1973C3|nr:NAD(P)H-hydrate dehydratase [Uliginosibacterium sp. H1]